MSAPIDPGDFVEVVKARRYPHLLHQVFRVAEVVPGSGCEAGCAVAHGGLHLVGLARAPRGWAACCFRPIYRPNSDFIESLKQPAPEREPEDA